MSDAIRAALRDIQKAIPAKSEDGQEPFEFDYGRMARELSFHLSNAMATSVSSDYACPSDFSTFTSPTGNASCSDDIGDLAKRVSEFEDELREAYRG